MTRFDLGFRPSRQPLALFERLPLPGIHPGEGRGPGGKVDVTMRGPQSATSPNWAPAFAGEAAKRMAWPLGASPYRAANTASARPISPANRSSFTASSARCQFPVAAYQRPSFAWTR